ncbi:MAG: Dephospho-CoA kinase [Promethearchaeota archaeon]|nr:MAG: Dephospho-CoA kinase [Candidatus Lokiarchaeota archaeon]
MTKRVIGFCGLPGSGKSTAIEAIADLGKIVTMGDVIRKEAIERGLSLTDENLGFVAKDLREVYGNNIIAKRCIHIIKSQSQDVIFIDGLRSMDEVEVFRGHWRFPVVAIIISQQKRFEIIRNRARDDDPSSLEELELRDEREIQFGLKEVIEKANFRIANEGSITQLKKETRQKVKKILKIY